MRATAERGAFLWLFFTAALIVLTCWIAVIPPFEGPDESAFYKDLVSYADRGTRAGGLPLYHVLLKPLVIAAGADARPFEGRYNPSFRFVSNRWGRVNGFLHGRAAGMWREDVRRMYLLRAATAMMWIASLVLVFETARLFFGRADLALLTASICLAIPQLSFFASVLHQEATSTLLGCVAYWALVARICGRLGRVALWLIALAVLALVPFSDRQAFFLLIVVPAGLLIAEGSWRRAALAALALTVPALILLLLPQFAAMRADIFATAFGMFTSSYQSGYWNADNPQYLAFEFLPKMFFGFVGWLGWPSILLPPWVYGASAVLVALAIAGLVITPWMRSRQRLTADQRRAAWILGLGVFLTIAPIVYANILVSRNSWYGRWLFPSVGPIAIALVFGWRSFLAWTRERPARAAVVLVAGAAILEGLWLTAPGDVLRTGIRGHHYGDQAHVIRTVGAAIVALGVTGLLIALSAAAARRMPRVRIGPATIAAGALTANLLLLAAFVRPLYMPIDAAGFAALIREELADGEEGRAAGLYRAGVRAYPESTTLRTIGEAHPMLLMTGGDDQMLALLQARIGRRDTLTTRHELMAFARIVRVKGWLEPAALRQVLSDAPEEGEGIGEARALLRLLIDGRTTDPYAGRDVIRAGLGRQIRPTIHDEMFLEGYTVHPGPTGFKAVTVYFRPLKAWSGRRIYINAYPPGSPNLVHLDPVPPPFGGWKRPELAWEVFHVPTNSEYDLLLGVAVGEDFGNAVHIGRI